MHSCNDSVDYCLLRHSEEYFHYTFEFDFDSLLIGAACLNSSLWCPWWGKWHRHEHHWHLMSHPVAADVLSVVVVRVVVVVVRVVVVVVRVVVAVVRVVVVALRVVVVVLRVVVAVVLRVVVAVVLRVVVVVVLMGCCSCCCIGCCTCSLCLISAECSSDLWFCCSCLVCCSCSSWLSSSLVASLFENPAVLQLMVVLGVLPNLVSL